MMTRDVITAELDTPFKQLELLMADRHISAVPVLDAEGNTVGVVSEADLLLRTEAAGDEPGDRTRGSRHRRAKAHAETAQGLMSSPARTIGPSAPLAAAARLMRTGGIKRLPVIDGGRLVGILSRADVLRSYLRSDADIRTGVVEGVIAASMWLDPGTVDVAVEDGVVRMSGELDRRSDVEILTTLTLGVEGVVAVESTVTFRFDDRHVTGTTEQHLT
jgi:CBS domain-containing protein